LVVGFIIGQAAKKSAQQFVLEYALENKEFYEKMIQGEVLVIKEIDKNSLK
jgi:hypothetical protein